MRKPTVDVEWTIVESDPEWEQLQQQSTPTLALATDGERYHHRMVLWRLALLCVLILVGAWGWASGRSGQRQVQQETADDTPMAVDKATATPAGLRTNQIDAPITAEWQAQFAREDELLQRDLQIPELEYQVLDQQGDQRLVKLIISTTLGRPAYRQTRFYIDKASGWQRTAPDPLLWGAPAQLATASFRFTFRARDAQTVTTVAPQLETLYTTMRRNFGLPLMPPGQKLAIEVSVTQQPRVPTRPTAQPGPLRVASPALYLAPATLTDEQLLTQSIVLLLLDHLLQQVNEYYTIPSAWQPLGNGLRLWQLWDLELPLAAWRQEVVQWLYVTLLATDTAQSVVLPPQYEALCRMHQLWLANPLQIYIPFWCNSQHQNKVDKLYMDWSGYRHPPVQLAQLIIPVPPHEYAQTASITERMAYPGQTVALVTLIEYAVATYGREALPTLLASLRQHEQWATLIPAVYGISPAEFEAGWGPYLVTHYGVSLETIIQ